MPLIIKQRCIYAMFVHAQFNKFICAAFFFQILQYYLELCIIEQLNIS